MSTSKHPLPIFSREIRLGLVLYGGLSLAIYMNGVCREFYNAIRGRGIYKLIKALTDSDVVVDIVSGTSAGGVNGVLLSYAIANSSHDAVVDFQEFAKLWIENADVEKLLGTPLERKNITSIFDGEKFYQKTLENAFTKYTVTPPENDWYSEFSELDLFVTATDLDGRINKVPDNTGKVIEIKDHRAIFHLKYRQDQIEYIDNPFRSEEINRKALAKLCRITSCFPVAFPVVEVNLYPDDVNEDCKLVNWGKLQNRELDRDKNQEECVLHFVDGGVLSNHPFTSTVETIYDRISYRPTIRKLFYVDPDPEKLLDNKNQKNSKDFWKDPVKVGFSSKIDIPNYQSISKDLESIKEGNRKVVRHQLLRKSLEEKDADRLRKFISFNKPDKENNYDDLEYSNYLKCRLLGLLDNSIKEILISSEERSDVKQKFLQEAAELLTNDIFFKETQEYLHDIYKKVTPLDVNFLVRKHCFLLSIISGMTQKFQEQNDVKQYLELRYLAYKLSWQIELLNIIQKSLDLILSGYEFNEILEERKADESKFNKLSEFLIVFYQTLLETTNDRNTEKENSLIVFYQTLLEITNDRNTEKENFLDESLQQREESWHDLLETYYELFKIIHFPNDIDFKKHPVDWAELKLLLPDQDSSLAKKIFAQIYQMPICKILTIEENKNRKQEVAKFKTNIKQKLAKCQGDNLKHDEQTTALCIINGNSKKWIGEISIDQDEKEKLQNYFDSFEIIDKAIYPYEYLSDVVTKNTIELVRISPDDANKGFGKEQNIKTKLRGYKLGAFGGFFKKAWRYNDMLWGRLDGLDRIVDALITPNSIKNFIQFRSKYIENSTLEDYLECLVQDSLPRATNNEKQVITNYLQCISPDSSCEGSYSQKEFENFLDCLVKAGQRQILVEDLKDVLTEINDRKDKSTEKMWESEQSQQLSEDSLLELDKKFKEYKDYEKKESQLNEKMDLGRNFWKAIENTFDKQHLEPKEPLAIKLPLGIQLWILIKIVNIIVISIFRGVASAIRRLYK